MVSSQNIAILILAAGASCRMGRTKQLLAWEGTTLLGNAIEAAKASKASSVVVVLGANSESIQKKIEVNGIEIVENKKWKSGLGSSIACGIKFLLKTHPKITAVLVMLADQPLIDTVYLNAMIATFNESGKGVATRYNSKAGVPALFPRANFEKLATLQDDFGAKNIINGPKEIFSVLNPGHKTRDIDTKSDYKKLINK